MTKEGVPKDGAIVTLRNGNFLKKTTENGGIAILDNDGKKFTIDSEVVIFVTSDGCFASAKKTIKFQVGDPAEKSEIVDLVKEGTLY